MNRSPDESTATACGEIEASTAGKPFCKAPPATVSIVDWGPTPVELEAKAPPGSLYEALIRSAPAGRRTLSSVATPELTGAVASGVPSSKKTTVPSEGALSGAETVAVRVTG